ncbi:MAG TPA: ATP-binding protein [Verrucomicrobiae bacterium]|nr:ATP-binding protein [Verrucomicrobiae bacterium]
MGWAMIFPPFVARRHIVLTCAAILIGTVAVIDWRVDIDVSFGFLYVFPVMLAASVLPRGAIALMAVLCTVLSDLFDPFPLTPSVGLLRDLSVFAALTGAGLFVHEVIRSRRGEMEHLQRIEQEVVARRQAEEQLAFLIDSSPVAILTMAGDGAILQANSSAHRLFGAPNGNLPGRNISRYVSALGAVPSVENTRQTFRTEMQCRGAREDGSIFPARVFFSTYTTAAGPRLAALIVDASEELREREESSLEHLLAGSRVVVGAVSHEIRNVCSAIAVLYENLTRDGRLLANKDFEALGSLVETLNKIASLEFKHSRSGARTTQIDGADLAELFDSLRIVLGPSCEGAGITVDWEIPEGLPPVWADNHLLLQALLNLTKNAERALERADVKRIAISVSVGKGSVSIRVTDTGPGIGSAEKLFRPFQAGAESTGLGLFLSRALVRSFRGDLRYDPTVPGCSFVIDLAVARSTEMNDGSTGTHEANTGAVA